MPNLSSLVNPNSAVITNSASQPVPTTVSDATVALEEVAFYLSKLVKMSESLAVVDTNQRQRVAVETLMGTGAGVRILDANINAFVYQNGGNSFQASNPVFFTVPDIWKIIDAARQNYQLSIRSNLTFS
jgi:hypothetical protein